MKKIAALGLGLAGLWVAVGIGFRLQAQSSPASPVVPSAGFLAAALQHQEAGGGGTLELIATSHRLDRPKAARMYHYIRTPEVLYIEKHYTLQDNRKLIVEASYDRATREFRLLSTSEAGGNKSGFTDFGLQGGTVKHQDILDLPRFPLFDGLLSEVIGRGKVAESMEAIDGHDCYRIDVTSMGDYGEQCTVWVDPEIGFCPRQIKTQWKRELRVITFTGYRNVGHGVWHPAQMNRHLIPIEPTTGETLRAEVIENCVEVKFVHVGKTFFTEDLIVEFPPGTEVATGADPDTIYTVPEVEPVSTDEDNGRQ